jgi:hypothetical protein
MTDQEKAREWLNAWSHVSPRSLAWHMTACLESDGERVLSEVFKSMKIKTPVDLVRAHRD